MRAYAAMARGEAGAGVGPPATPLGRRMAEALSVQSTPPVRSAAALQAAVRELLRASSRTQAEWLVEKAYAGDMVSLMADLLSSLPVIHRASPPGGTGSSGGVVLPGASHAPGAAGEAAWRA